MIALLGMTAEWASGAVALSTPVQPFQIDLPVRCQNQTVKSRERHETLKCPGLPSRLSFGLPLAPSGVSAQGKAAAVEDVLILAHAISGSSNEGRESDPGFGSSAASSHSINDRGPTQLRATRIDGEDLRAEYWIVPIVNIELKSEATGSPLHDCVLADKSEILWTS